MKKFRYKNILLYSSHQWTGNNLEYFSETTEKLVVFLLMPRIQNEGNTIRIYEKGKLIKEEEISLSENFFMYYFMWNFQYARALFKYFSWKDKVVLISAHPYPFFAMTLQKMIRNITFVFWIADYFPPINRMMIIFEAIKRFYHKNIDYACYLGDGVNKVMNGKIVNTSRRKTIMWGVRPKNIQRDITKIKYTLLYVGVVRESVGLDLVYEFLSKHKQYNLKIIGICDEALYKKHKGIIKKLNINKQVYFPNRFFYENELDEISKECCIGLALYTTDNTNTIYYSDPGKVKTYSEIQLPVIISKTSSIISYIKKFRSGEIIDRDTESLYNAIIKITKDYKSYLGGIKKFNEYFYYKTYYNEKFKFLKEVFSS